MMALVHRSFCFRPFLCPSIHVLSLLALCLGSTRDAEQGCTQHKLPVYRRATTSLRSHIYGQLRVANSPHTLNFGLWEEASKPAENPHRQGLEQENLTASLFFALFYYLYFLLHIPLLYFLLYHSSPPLWSSLWSNYATHIRHPQCNQ